MSSTTHPGPPISHRRGSGLALLLRGFGAWVRRSPGAWVGLVGLAGLWPVLEAARGLDLVPGQISTRIEFGGLVWVGCVAGTCAGLGWLARQEVGGWWLGRAELWRAQAGLLLICALCGAVACGGLSGLERALSSGLPGATGAGLELLLLAPVHAFLGLALLRAWPAGPGLPIGYLSLVWALPALVPQRFQAWIEPLVGRPEAPSGGFDGLGAVALASAGWLLLSLRQPRTTLGSRQA